MGVTFHVGPDGDDAGEGTEARPFATVLRAQAAARLAGPGTRVLLHPGTHRLDRTWVLGPEDSGLTVAAAGGGVSTLSGGVRVAGPWEHWRDGIWTCPVGEAVLRRVGDRRLDLFVDGRRQTLARYPNTGWAEVAGADEWPHRELRYDPSAFSPRAWSGAGAIVHCFTRAGWGNVQWRVWQRDAARGVLSLGAGGWQMAKTFQRADGGGIGPGCRFFVENVLEELDAPGEWYLDRADGLLYLMPPEGVRPDAALVELATLEQLVLVRGTREGPVRDVRLVGLRVAHSLPVFLEGYEEPSLGDWAIRRSGAVGLQDAEDCAVQDCLFDAPSGNALFVDGYARGVRVEGCTFRDVGESAVCLVGRSHLRTDGRSRCAHCGAEHRWAWGAPAVDIPSECTVAHCRIHDVGIFGKQTAGVFLGLTRRTTVAHNEIHRVPRAGICLNDGLHGGHVIEYNDVYDTVRETGDHGPLNAWGREGYWCRAQSHGGASHAAGEVTRWAAETTVIRHNRFRDGRGWGIDLDDGASNYHVHGNLCIGVSVKLREGDLRTVEHNVFIHPANPPGIHVGYEGNRDRFEHNIVVMSLGHDVPETDVTYAKPKGEGACYQVIAPPAQGPILEAADWNVFWSDAGSFAAEVSPRGGGRVRYSLEQWRGMGYDRHSVFADPRFVDPARGDYRVAEGSPALGLGFRQLELGDVGPRVGTVRWE